jgi:hypothetical protein
MGGVAKWGSAANIHYIKNKFYIMEFNKTSGLIQ